MIPLLIMALQAPAPVQPEAPPTHRAAVIANAEWTSRPTPQAFNRSYPERARQMKVNGDVTLRCTVVADGALTACEVIRETPDGYGFGRAALSVSSMFRMEPKTRDGVSVEGASVTIPMHYKLN